MFGPQNAGSQRTWIFKADVRGYYIPAKPLVIGDFELKRIEDKERGTRCIAQLTVQAEDLDSAGKLARRKFDRIFKSIMLSAGREFEFKMESATEITPDKQDEREHMGYETITFPFVEILKTEKVEQLRDETEEILRLLHKSDSFSQKAVEYFMIGIKLSRWPREAFLSFFKAIELISDRFLNEFETRIKGQIPDLEHEEINRLATSRRKILNACEILGIENVSEKTDVIVKARNKFDVAHATPKKAFKNEYLDECRELAGKIIVAYMKLLQNNQFVRKCIDFR